MSTTSRTTTTTAPSPTPIPISPFTICSAISEATSDDIPDLGAFHTVLREWNHLQPPPRIPRMYPSSNSTITTTQTLPTDSQTPIEGSTVWNHLPLDSYLVSHASTTPGADTRSSPLSPPQSAPHSSSPPHRLRSHSDGELDYGYDDGTESARTVEINSEHDSGFDEHELSMELTPDIQIEEGDSDDDFQDPDAPSLGYLDEALSFIAAERARWVAQRESGGAATSSSSANLGLAIEARKKRRRRRRPSKRRGMDGTSTALSTSSMSINQTMSPIMRTTSSSQQEGSSAESYTQRFGTSYPSDQDCTASLSQRSLVEGEGDLEYLRNQAYLSRRICNFNASSPGTPLASKIDISDSINYEELQRINSGLDSGSTLRNAKSTPHLRPGVVEESESSAADDKGIATKRVLNSKGGLSMPVLSAADLKFFSSLHYNSPAMLSPSAPTSMTAINPSRSTKGDSLPPLITPNAVVTGAEVDSSIAAQPAPLLEPTTPRSARQPTLKEQHEKFQQHLREYQSKPKAPGPSEAPGILPSQAIQRQTGHRRSKSAKIQKSSFSGNLGSPASPTASNAVRLGDDETVFSSLSRERRLKLIGLTKKLVQAFPEDREDLGRFSRHLAGNKATKMKVRDESGSGVESARRKSEDEVLLKSSSKPKLMSNEGEMQESGGRMIHVFIDHSNILIGLLSYLKRHSIQKKLQSGAGAIASSSSTSLSTIYHQSNNVYNNSGHNTRDTKTYSHHSVEYASYNSPNTLAAGATKRITLRIRGVLSSTEEEGYENPNKHQHAKKRSAHKSTQPHDFVEGIGGELGFVNAVLGNSGYVSAGTNYHSDSGKGGGRELRSATVARKKHALKMWHAALALILERGRSIHRRVLVTSSPLYQPLDAMERLGYEARIYLRVPDFGDGMDRDRERFRAGLSVPNTQGKLGAIAAGGRTSPPAPSSSPSKHITSNTGSMRGKKSKGRAELASIGGFTSDREGIPIASARHGHRRGNSTGTNSTVTNLGVSPPAPQRIKYREQGVDELLQLKLHQALAATDDVPDGSTIILATGDGNVGQFNEDGFLGPVRTALRRGWRVELVAWEGGLSRAWKREFGEGSEWWEKGLFRVIHLEQFVNFLVDADDELI